MFDTDPLAFSNIDNNRFNITGVNDPQLIGVSTGLTIWT